jgi:hypothetical protein
MGLPASLLSARHEYRIKNARPGIIAFKFILKGFYSFKNGQNISVVLHSKIFFLKARKLSSNDATS